jgi:hypothetical protein
MPKFCLAFFAAAGLLFAFGISAEAGGRTAGAAFTPPGWSHNTVAQEHSGWTSNSITGVQPRGWSQNTVGQTKRWNSSIVAPRLNSH